MVRLELDDTSCTHRGKKVFNRVYTLHSVSSSSSLRTTKRKIQKMLRGNHLLHIKLTRTLLETRSSLSSILCNFRFFISQKKKLGKHPKLMIIVFFFAETRPDPHAKSGFETYLNRTIRVIHPFLNRFINSFHDSGPLAIHSIDSNQLYPVSNRIVQFPQLCKRPCQKARK